MKKALIAVFIFCSLSAFGQASVPLYELLTVSGTDTYTVTKNPTPSLTNGLKIPVKFTNANTGASTLNVSGTGAVTLRKHDGTALSSGDIPAGSDWWVIYDGTASQWRLIGGGSSAAAGITDINGQTGSSQIITTDGTGTDVGVSSSSDTHTIHLPTASGSARGVLSSANWTTFNNKQSAITFGTGVQTALGVNIGSAGAPVLFNGAGGTPSSMTGTNITGLPLTTGVTGILPLTNGGTGTTDGSGLPYRGLNGTYTMTGTVTDAFGSNPWIITSGVTTGTGATAGIQGGFNSLTSGNGVDYATSSLTSGKLLSVVSTSTAINHTAGTNALGWFQMTGANANNLRTHIGVGSSVTTTGTNSTNIAGYFNASGAGTNYSIFATGLIRIQTPGGGIMDYNVNAISSNTTLAISATSGITINSNTVGTFSVSSGTGASAGFQFVGNSLTTGNLIDASSTSATTGFLAKYTSTSTVINHTAGTHALVGVDASGANSTSGKTVVGFMSKVANTGTTSVNVPAYFTGSGATTNYGSQSIASGGTLAYGIYASAANATTNYAGYFDGTGNSSGTILINTGLSTGRSQVIFSRAFGATDKKYWTINTIAAEASNVGSSLVISTLNDSFASITDVLSVTRGGGFTFTQANLSSLWIPIVTLQPGTLTALTAATEFNSLDAKGSTWTWIDGTVATQRFAYFRAFTLNKTTTSATFTDTYRAYIEKSVAGTGVTITNNYALGLDGDLNMVSTTSAIRLNGSAGTSGQVLTSAGTGATPTWTTPSASITVGTSTITSGTNTRVPFNDSGVYGEDAGLVYNKTNDALTVGVARIHSIGTRNTFVGESSGNFTLSGTDNTAFGYITGTAITSGNGNTFLGRSAGGAVTSGSTNTYIGYNAGGTTTTSNNTVLGANSGSAMTGSNNLLLGYSAAITQVVSGNENILIGYNVDLQSASASNQLSIQNAIFGSGNSGSGTTVSSGNLGFWATTWGTSAAKVISIGNGTAPSTSITDGIQIYAEDVAASSELKVRDEAGNTTTLSPHNFSLIGSVSEPGAWSFYGEFTNKETGERQAINVDMLKAIRLLERLTGEKLVYKTKIDKK